MSLTRIDDAAALRTLDTDPLRHLAEMIQLEQNRPPFPRQAFGDTADSSLLMLVTESPAGARAFVARHDVDFLDDCWVHLDSEFPGGFALSSPDGKVLGSGLARRRMVPESRRTVLCLACQEARSRANIDCHYRLLGPAEGDRFVDYPHPSEDRPDPARLFQWIVRDGQGEIVVAETAGQIVGFLSCMHEIRDFWDIDFIHVRPDHRDRGVGTGLAAFYAQRRLGKGEIPYYSGPANEASRRTAEHAGFVVCRELVSAQIAPRTWEHPCMFCFR